MRKVLSFLITIFLTFNLFAINITYNGTDITNYHDHQIYKVLYSFTTKNPVAVYYTLTNTQAIEADAVNNRTNDFRPCSLGSSSPIDYYKKGFDKGHMAGNGDFDYSKEGASLTFLMCNMCPQTHSLNAGKWLKYEKRERSLAKTYGSIDIICGPLYDEDKKPIYIGNLVRVPDKFFKIFKYKDIIECYIFSQDNSNPIKSSMEEIEKLSNIKITF